MMNVTTTHVELGCMTKYLNDFTGSDKAKERNFAERGLVSFLTGFWKMRNGTGTLVGAGWKIQTIKSTYEASTLDTEYTFTLTNVQDRIRINAEEKIKDGE